MLNGEFIGWDCDNRSEQERIGNEITGTHPYPHKGGHVKVIYGLFTCGFRVFGSFLDLLAQNADFHGEHGSKQRQEDEEGKHD